MSAADNGGPAFPVLPPVGPDGTSDVGYPYVTPGISIRDYFAAKFMNRAQSPCESNGGWEMELAAQCAYQMADAMMEARK